LQAIDGIRAAARFENNPIRPAIHFLKYRNHKVVAAALGQILVDAYRRYQLAVDVIVPVPLHPSRLRERGYNQSELLAWQVSRAVGLPVNTRALERAQKTKSQMTLGAAERHQNVAAAFSCSQELARQKVLLIDDVCTTGATLDSCAAAMKEKGVTSVWGLTLAR
jgi:ComF family protein